MPAKIKTDRLRKQFLDLSSRIQDVYDDISLLNENLAKPMLSYGATHHKLLFLPYFSSQIRQEWTKTYTKEKQKKAKSSKRLLSYNAFLTDRLKELDFDISILRSRDYNYLFN